MPFFRLVFQDEKHRMISDWMVGTILMANILYISLAPIARSARETRQITTLLDSGHTVMVAGYSSANTIDPRWHFIDLLETGKKKSEITNRDNAHRKTEPTSIKTSLKRFMRSRYERLLGKLPRILPLLVWRNREHYSALKEKLHHACKGKKFSLIICRDWFSAPYGLELARLGRGVPLIIDEHEHALSQISYSQWYMKWLHNRFNVPYIRKIQGEGVRCAHHVFAVSDGIAKYIAQDYGIDKAKVSVLRNTPNYRPLPLNEWSETRPLQLLYLGILHPERPVDILLEAMRFLSKDKRRTIHLTLCGPGPLAYAEKLRARIKALGLEQSVTVMEPVPFAQLLEHANRFDVGLLLPQTPSIQLRYSLPNKLFEYIMAGLSLCVTDFPEMGAIVQKYVLGVTLAPTASPQEIAQVWADLAPSQINCYKRNALNAAKTLCWEKESEIFLAVCNRLVGKKDATSCVTQPTSPDSNPASNPDSKRRTHAWS